MSDASQKKSQRRGARGVPKVKTGCMTCRKRHKKCDEARPACSQCRSSGWDCDFAAAEGPARHESTPKHMQWRSLARRQPSTLVTLSESDVLHLDYFRVACTRRAAHFLGNNFMEAYVLPAVFTEQCVLDATLALGAMSRRRMSPQAKPDTATPSNPAMPAAYPLAKYYQAIQGLRQRLVASPDNWGLAVLTSIVFLVIEAHQMNYSSVQVHIRSSLAILKSLGSPPDRIPRTEADMAETLTAFSKALKQPSTATKDRVLEALELWPSLPPKLFASIHEARSSLNSITASLTSLQGPPRRPQDPGLVYCSSRLSRLLGSWHSLFAKFIEQNDMDSEARADANILLIHHRAAHISASTCVHGTESAYDYHMPDFLFIVHLATDVILKTTRTAKTSMEKSGHDMFADTTAVLLQPLFLVASKCRDGLLRRRAIKAMGDIATTPPRSTHYYSGISVQVARFIVSQEERGVELECSGNNHVLPGTVREEDRLRNVELRFEAEDGGYRVKAWRRKKKGEAEEVQACLYMPPESTESS